jgi:hypothetical protein
MKGGWVMVPLRKELQTFAGLCERLLSFDYQPELTADEKHLVAYYVEELARQFGDERSDQTAVPGQSGRCEAQLHLQI